MSAEKETLRRVQDGIFHLQRGLVPFVEGWMRKAHGEQWLAYASRASGSGNGALDAYGLLKTMIDRWREVFEAAFAQKDRHSARNFVSMALEARNAVSHLTLPLQDDEALRYLDAMWALLRLTKAPAVEVTALKALYDAQRNSGAERAPPPAEAPPAPPQLTLSPTDGPARALKPWTEVALPHPDVIANRFKEAEFAADLFAVDSGNVAVGDAYATPQDFFGITFLTEGLKRVLEAALLRLAGRGGDPVIGLQTSFGGGKTHTMLALFHLAAHLRAGGDPRTLPGLAPLVEKIGVTNWPKPEFAVFVGSSKGADSSGVFQDLRGKAGLVARADLPDGWSPVTDRAATIWECVQHTIRVLNAEDGGAEAAAALVAQMGQRAEDARALAYRLFEIATKRGWAAEALIYNALAQEWPRLAEMAPDVIARGPLNSVASGMFFAFARVISSPEGRASKP
jgi:hypothetical protein